MNLAIPGTALIALLLAACASAPVAGTSAAHRGATASTSAPTSASTATPGAVAATPPAVLVALTEGDFREKGPAHRTLEVRVPVGGQVVVDLGSNPTTGYAWNAQALIADGTLLRQLSHAFTGAGKVPIPGAGGTEQWVLMAEKAGTTEVRWAYARSWAAGEPAWSLTLKVTAQ